MEVNFLLYIILFPFIGAFINRIFGGWLLKRSAVNIISCSSVFLSFIFALRAFLILRGIHAGEHEVPSLIQTMFTWIHVGKLEVFLRLVVDPLSSVMILVVSGVGFLIHVYSTGYMSHDKEYPRFFAYMNLFTAMMLVLVLGDSLLVMFIGWEGVGLCSYLLIGFWFKDNANASAGKKAFIVNRIGDFGFMVGILTIFWALGTQSDVWTFGFGELKENIVDIQGLSIFGFDLLTFAAIFLFIGATGKSAQIPLYIWLPDAMAGPTPVSALIHAATMVTSGVYMICRLNFLFELAPIAMDVVAWTGVLTAFYAATIAIFQYDIKKVLAYSTISQLGYMFVGVGVGAYSAGLFHLMTHAFFKALLFLGAGSVMHAVSNKQDMREMGGLRKYIPYTFYTFLFGYLAISGLFPFAGFFSKDEILWKAANRNWGIWLIGLITAGLTAFYMTRLFVMTFFGKERFDENTKKHLHESPFKMTIPLMVLALLSIVGGWVGWPHFLFHGHNYFHQYTSSVFGHGHADNLGVSMEWTLMLISVAVAGTGIIIAWYLYSKKTEALLSLKDKFRIPYKVLYNKYYVDEIYGATFVRGTFFLSRISALFDKYVVDGFVNGCGWALRVFAYIDGTIDKYIVDGAVNGIASLTISIGKGIRNIQTGRVYNYLLIMMCGFIGMLISIYYFLR